MSTTALKLLALITMTIDHVGEFIPNTPSWFRLIGRIAAPLFIFCTAQGFYYTHNRKKYLIRMYLCGVLMAFMNLYLNTHTPSHCDYYVTNNIFPTLFSICVVITLIELIIKNFPESKKYIWLFSIWQLIGILIVYFVNFKFPDSYVDSLILGALLGSAFFNNGGLPIILLGVLLYFCRNRKKHLIISYTLFCVTYFNFSFFSIIARLMNEVEHNSSDFIYNSIHVLVSLLGFETVFITPISAEYFFNFHFQWALLAALPFMLLYNNQKGKGFKWLFYIFYPLHILILYYIGSLLS